MQKSLLALIRNNTDPRGCVVAVHKSAVVANLKCCNSEISVINIIQSKNFKFQSLL